MQAYCYQRERISMVISTPRMVGRGTATLILALGLVAGVILGVLAPGNFGGAGNDNSDHHLRGLATGINSDVRSAAAAGKVRSGSVPAMHGSRVWCAETSCRCTGCHDARRTVVLHL